MDGNGRWARQRALPRIAGHRAGVENVRNLVSHCVEIGVEALTLFAFSSENWRRPPTEVKLLMELFTVSLEEEAAKLNENGIRLRMIGERRSFAAKLQRRIAEAEALTSHNTRLNLVIAADYGGRWDIAQAAKKLTERVLAGALSIDEISPAALQAQMSIADLPEPDLFIRSGGEQRISNFLLWQLAYTEFYFTDCLWPDFGPEEFDRAVDSYAQRQRRFGMTSEQIDARRTSAASG